jgi:peptidyl-prolyl cis-trans isomerase D
MGADDDPTIETITKDQRFALLSVTQVIPAAPPPLAKIADRVKADFLAQRANERAKALASAILAKVNAGVPIRQAFGEAGVSLPPIQTVTAKRVDISRQDARVPAAVAAMFRLKKGRAIMLPAPQNAGWFVARLDEVVPGDPASSPGMISVIQNQLGQTFGPEYAQQFARSLARDVKVERNEDAINALKAQLTKSSAGE